MSDEKDATIKIAQSHPIVVSGEMIEDIPRGFVAEVLETIGNRKWHEPFCGTKPSGYPSRFDEAPTVAEVIKMLSEFPQDAKVLIEGDEDSGALYVSSDMNEHGFVIVGYM